MASSESTFHYDAFLSFSVKDKGKGFTDHLYHELCRSGVRVFRDSERLRRCANLNEQFGVMERSEIFVLIFSKNFVSSKLCLMEVEKMVKIATEGKRKRLIIPVFYRLDLANVREQEGHFGVALRKYEVDKNLKAVKEYGEALKKATEFSGYESRKISNGHEASLVQVIVRRVLEELMKNGPRDAVEHAIVGPKSSINMGSGGGEKQECPRTKELGSPLDGIQMARRDKGKGTAIQVLYSTANNDSTIAPDLSKFYGAKELTLGGRDYLVKNKRLSIVFRMTNCKNLKEKSDRFKIKPENRFSLERPDCIVGRTYARKHDVSGLTSESAALRKVQRISSSKSLQARHAQHDFDISRRTSAEEAPDITSIAALINLEYISSQYLKGLHDFFLWLSSHPIVKFLREFCLGGSYNWTPLSSNVTENKTELALTPRRASRKDQHHLKELYLSGLRIQKLQDSSLQKNLLILHLNDCELLEEVPEQIADLCLLEVLSLTNCPLIKELPKRIGLLKKLRCLNLSHCIRLTHLPDGIGDLESLAELLLENTSLAQLPKSIKRLRMLKILHLGSCRQLASLPLSIGELENLTQLVLDETIIEELPGSVASLKKLELLSVRGCKKIKHLPAGLREDMLLLCGGSQVQNHAQQLIQEHTLEGTCP